MPRRLKVPVYRPGQVPPGGAYELRSWDPADPRVADLLKYRPRYMPSAWQGHAEVIRDLVLRTPYVDKLRDRHWAGTLHAFFTWAEEKNYSTKPAALLTGDRIDAFLATGFWTSTSTPTHRSRLRKTAALVFPAPPEAAYPRRDISPGYTPAEVDRFRAACEALIHGRRGDDERNRALHREVSVILALTFGAGCGAKMLHHITEADVQWLGDVLWVSRPGRSLPVPVQPQWSALLAPTLTGDPGARLIKNNSTGKRNEAVGKVLFRARAQNPGFSGFDSDRAARTWQLHVLESANYDVLVDAAGGAAGARESRDVRGFLPERDRDQALAILAGWCA